MRNIINTPINISIVVFILSFILSFFVIYIFNPKFIQIVDKRSGKIHIYWPYVVLYSFIISLLCAIAALLVKAKLNTPEKVKIRSFYGKNNHRFD